MNSVFHFDYNRKHDFSDLHLEFTSPQISMTFLEIRFFGPIL